MGFYDYKGYWRNDGDGFYDAKGYFRGPNDGFYDSKGYFRSPGDGFYDAKGYFRSPGDGFYDTKGNYCSGKKSAVTDEISGLNKKLSESICLVLFVPIILAWMMLLSVIEWIASNVYVVFVGYLTLTALFCLLINKVRKHHGVKGILSFIGNFLCTITFVYVVLIYAVPYVFENGRSFGSVFEFTIVSIFVSGGIAVIQFFNYYHEKAILECIVGVLYFAIVIGILKQGSDIIDSIGAFCQLYHLENQTVARVLFGFAL